VLWWVPTIALVHKWQNPRFLAGLTATNTSNA
jgi:hypothetical protein